MNARTQECYCIYVAKDSISTQKAEGSLPAVTGEQTTYGCARFGPSGSSPQARAGTVAQGFAISLCAGNYHGANLINIQHHERTVTFPF